MKSDADILKEARETIRAGWTTGAYARDRWYDPVDTVSDKACAWCVIGALRRVNDGYYPPDSIVQLLCKVIGHEGQADIGAITRWNDSSSRISEEVIALFDQAISRLEEK